MAKESLKYLVSTLDVDIDEAIFPDDIVDSKDWLLDCHKNNIASKLRITCCIRLEPHITNSSLFTSSIEIKEPENVVMQFLHHNQLITIPYLQGIAFEMHQLANKAYLEPWIVPEVSYDLAE